MLMKKFILLMLNVTELCYDRWHSIWLNGTKSLSHINLAFDGDIYVNP